MSRITPLGALARGIAAGAAGAGVQTLFFKSTAKLLPPPPAEAFEPPEPIQASEMATATVARRLVEQLMQRGPLTDEDKALGAALVHYGVGAAWGGLYGLLRETFASLRHPITALGLGALVWLIDDNVVLPAFKLAAGPGAYAIERHAYALAAHLAYGIAVWAVFEAARRAPLGAIVFWGARRGALAWIDARLLRLRRAGEALATRRYRGKPMRRAQAVVDRLMT